jgi:hypothetical protein
MPAHRDVAKALREGGQLVIIQQKMPTHSQIAKALREGGQLVIRQPKLGRPRASRKQAKAINESSFARRCNSKAGHFGMFVGPHGADELL